MHLVEVLYQGTTGAPSGSRAENAQNEWGFTGCGKTQLSGRWQKQIAPECPRNDLQDSGNDFVSPNFGPFTVHSEFFRSLFSL